MSAQPEYGWGTMPLPEIRTVDDLRSALSRYGFPGDRERFEEELAAAIGASPTDDFAGAAAVVRAYRHIAYASGTRRRSWRPSKTRVPGAAAHERSPAGRGRARQEGVRRPHGGGAGGGPGRACGAAGRLQVGKVVRAGTRSVHSYE